MPVKSKKQWKYLAIHHPELLHKWQEEAPVVFENLPNKKKSEHAKDWESPHHSTIKEG